jgi:hypothetical protein
MKRKGDYKMTDNFIKLNESDVLRLKIRTENGEETGEELVFDLEDIELPLIYQDMLEGLKKNAKKLENQILIIDKRQDVKGKKLMSKNEEDKIKAFNDFYKEQERLYNMFLGENGVKKLLNGRKLGWTSLQEIDEIIEKQILPYIDIDMKKISDKIKVKYKNDTQNEVIK